MPTLVTAVGMTAITAKGKNDVGDEQRIAYIIQGKDAEDNIVYGTHGDKSTQIENGIVA